MGCRSCCRESERENKHKKGLWSPEEDKKLMAYITRFGHGSWTSLPKLAGLERCGKSCRLRWINYLRPGLKRGAFSILEEKLIIEAQAVFGNRWSMIAKLLPGRTDNEIKNFWNSNIKKKLIHTGIHPKKHKSNALQIKGTFAAQGKALCTENCTDHLQSCSALMETNNSDAVCGSIESVNCIPAAAAVEEFLETDKYDDLSFLENSGDDLRWYSEAEMTILSEFGEGNGSTETTWEELPGMIEEEVENEMGFHYHTQHLSAYGH